MFVYRGTAKVSLAPFPLQLGVTPPGTEFDVGEGDVVNVPRDRAYQIMPASGRFQYVALRRFALQQANPAPLPPVTSRKQIDEWFAAGTAGTAGIQPGINRIILDRANGTDWREGGAPGPWENHERNEHLSIVTYGTAKAVLDQRRLLNTRRRIGERELDQGVDVPLSAIFFAYPGIHAVGIDPSMDTPGS